MANPCDYKGNRFKNEKRTKALRKRTKARDVGIVKEILAGKTDSEIAKGVGLTVSGVRKVRNRDDIRKMLEKEYLKMASAVPVATEKIINAAQEFSKDQESEDKKISWEANKLIAQAHGLLPTSSQSVVHQTYINNQVNTIIPPVIAELAAKHFVGLVNMASVKDGEKEVFEIEGSDADA
jgi:DNA-directed RNA polymerase specialized sigma24 family protein